MLQGGPRTSTCSQNFFGVRFGVSEISLKAYPTVEIRCNYELSALTAVCTARAIRIRVWDFELVTLTGPLFRFYLDRLLHGRSLHPDFRTHLVQEIHPFLRRHVQWNTAS